MLAVENALNDTHRLLVEFKRIREPELNVFYPEIRVDHAETFLALTCSTLWKVLHDAAPAVLAAAPADVDVDSPTLTDPRTRSDLLEMSDAL